MRPLFQQTPRLLPNLIRYIVSEVQDTGFEILRTRLVKLLYLCDVEYFQSNRRLITDLEWVRYKFGPYAFELPEITHRMGLDLGEEEIDFSSGRGVKYEVYDVPEPDRWLDVSQKRIVDKVIKRWGGEDLNVLLDYVYCETQPMRSAQFLQPLDFRHIASGLRNSETDTLELEAAKRDEIIRRIAKEGIYAEEPIVYRISDSKKKLGGDETEIPKIIGRVKFSDTRRIRPFEGQE